jgi:hypothetical protein
LKSYLPGDVELIGEYTHALGTEYNGFLLFEAEKADLFLDCGLHLRIALGGTSKRDTRSQPESASDKKESHPGFDLKRQKKHTAG